MTAKAEISQPGVTSMLSSRALRGKAPWNGSKRAANSARASASSQAKALSRASGLATSRVTSVAHQAPSSLARSPKASSTSTRPRMLDRKWLTSISTTGLIS